MFISKAAYGISGSWQAGPGFVTGSGKPIIVLDSFCNWNPFPDDPDDEGRKSSVNLINCNQITDQQFITI